MRGNLFILGSVLILSTVIVGGCVSTRDDPVGLPNPAAVYCEEQGYTVEMRTDADGGQYGVCIFPDGSECDEWAFYRGECGPGTEEVAAEAPDPGAARDAALAYIIANYGEEAPLLDWAWTEEENTSEGPTGSSTFRYTPKDTAGDWVVAVSFPMVAPESVVYQVVVASQTTGFQWEGEVDAAGQVTETLAPIGGLPVVGWLGHVVSTPDDAQFDDYLVLQPEGTGEVGVEGANEAVEAEIVALRDKEEPGKYAHFWGTLTCDVPDYGGCQLVVTRVRVGQTYTEPEPVEAWEGIIVSNPPGAQFDDYFVLAGDFPVGYGIGSIDPQVKAQLESLRDTGITARVWGQLRTGVPDAYGSQIEVRRVEGAGDPLAPTPMPQDSAP